MTITTFRLRYKSGVCASCHGTIERGSMAYRLGSRVYCSACRPDGSQTPPPASTHRARRPAAQPDPSAHGGSMPGEHSVERDADGVWRYGFDSVSEAVTDALDDYAQNDSTREYLRGRLRLALSGHDDWASNFTRTRFLNELAAPSQTLLDAVDRMREKLVEEVSPPSMPRRRVRRGQEFGEELDSDRYLSRNMAPWDRTVREHQTRRTVTVGCNLSANGGVTARELLYRGAAALALADLLTGRGVNVEIVLFDSREDPTSTVRRTVLRHKVKDATMPLDLSTIAFAMCEIAYFRVVMAIGGMRHFPGEMSESLGCAKCLPAADRKGIDFLIEADVLSEDAATEWLKTCMAGQTGEVCHA